jgi:hypothetical protein
MWVPAKQYDIQMCLEHIACHPSLLLLRNVAHCVKSSCLKSLATETVHFETSLGNVRLCTCRPYCRRFEHLYCFYIIFYFVYGMFNNDFNSSYHTASNDKVISG